MCMDGFFKPFDIPEGPTIPERNADIRDFGAVEGGVVCNTQAIRNAIDALSSAGGGRVVFPRGRWLTGPIHLRSGIELHLEKGCEVIFSTRRDDYLPAVFTLYEGMRCHTFSAQLYARDCHDIAITGEGVFDGQGFAWWYMAAMYPDGPERLHEACEKHVPVEQRVFNTEEQGLRPGMLHFVSCRNVLIEGCTFRFSPFWTLHPTWCENIIVRGIRVINPYDHAPNTDGCNLEGCRIGLVEDVWVDTGDDAVCLKAGRDEDGRLQQQPCENIVLRRITAKRSHGGVTIGSEMSSGVRNVLVEDCDFQQSLIGLWIKSAPERGGSVRDIEYHRIRAGQLRQQGICITMGYCTDGAWTGDADALPVIENILVDGFHCEHAGTAVLLDGCEARPLRGIRLANVTASGDASIRASHVEDLGMENVSFY